AADATLRHGLSINIWICGLWALTVPYFILLSKMITLPDHISLSRIRFLHILWCIWLAAFAFWWLAGNWTLIPQPPFQNPPKFIFAQQTFVWLTLTGHVFTVLLLTPSVPASLSVLSFGFFVPFIFLIRNELRDPFFVTIWFSI